MQLRNGSVTMSEKIGLSGTDQTAHASARSTFLLSSRFYESLLSSLPYCPHFSTFLTSLLCSLLYFLHFLYCPHFPAVFTSLLYSLTLRSSHLYFLHLPSAFTSLLSSLPSCLHFPTGPELFPKQRVHTEGFLR
jgi:hypothetical protein